MDREIRVSVVIPVYNSETYLRECLDSIIEQTLKEIEIICIDDGSTDGSSDILAYYAKNDCRFTVVSQENQGQSSARNRGIQLARGKFVLFVDSDDMLALDAIEYLYNEALKLNLDVLYFDATTVFEDQKLSEQKKSMQEYYVRENKYGAIVTGAELFSKMRKHQEYRVSPCLQFIRKEILDESGVQFPLGIIHEDNLFTTQLLLSADRVSHTNRQLYIRRVRHNSTMTNNEDFKNLYGYFRSAMGLANFAKSKGLSSWKPIDEFVRELQYSTIRIHKKLSSVEKAHIYELPEAEQRLLVELTSRDKAFSIEQIQVSQLPPKVSVVIPVYNTEKYLAKCLDSVVGQSLRDIEIICVNDGSQDKSLEICNCYAAKDERIVVITQENQGLSAARNTGIEYATGDYLAFIDSDDMVHPNFLEALYRLCTDNSCLISICGVRKFCEEKDLDFELECLAAVYYSKDILHRRFEANGWVYSVAWNKLYHRSLFEDIRYPYGKIHEDEFTTYRVLWKVKRIATTDSELYFYRQHTESIMGQAFNEKRLHAIEAYEERADFFKERNMWLYKKSLIALNSCIYRNRKEVKKHCPDRTDLIQMLDKKYDKMQQLLCEENMAVSNPPPDYPSFTHEECEIMPATFQYDMRAKYCTAQNTEAGLVETGCKISVIVPVYNTGEYLEECIESIANQSIKELEIIAVDDGSTDNSLSLLRRFQHKDNRIVVLTQQNLGVFVARNRALMRAKGEFVCFMDSDDFYPTNTTLEMLYNKAKEHDVLICGGSFSNYRDGVISEEFTEKNTKYKFSEEGTIKFSDYQFDYGFHRFIYNRHFLLENKIVFPPYKRFQDPPFFVKAMVKAEEFYAVPDVVYRYRCGFQAKPASWPREKLHDMLRGYLDNLNISREYNLGQLHALTLERLEDDYSFSAIMNSLLQYDYEGLNLLIQLNGALDKNLLKSAGVDFAGKDYYVVRQLKNLIWRANNGQNSPNTKIVQNESMISEAELIRASWSYRIGRIMTFIPRKIRGGIRCYREHGANYTFERVLIHLHLKKDPYNPINKK